MFPSLLTLPPIPHPIPPLEVGTELQFEFPESHSFLSFVMIHLSDEETEALRDRVTCQSQSR